MSLQSAKPPGLTMRRRPSAASGLRSTKGLQAKNLRFGRADQRQGVHGVLGGITIAKILGGHKDIPARQRIRNTVPILRGNDRTWRGLIQPERAVPPTPHRRNPARHCGRQGWLAKALLPYHSRIKIAGEAPKSAICRFALGCHQCQDHRAPGLHAGLPSPLSWPPILQPAWTPQIASMPKPRAQPCQAASSTRASKPFKVTRAASNWAMSADAASCGKIFSSSSR